MNKLSPGRLPGGPLAADDLTLELGVRRLLDELVHQPVGYIEQLYTFGDRQRGRNSQATERTISVAYLGLMPSLPKERTVSFYALFPWEDRRGRWEARTETLLEQLRAWAEGKAEREWRCRVLFALQGSPWSPERVLERYELLYEAGLVSEADTRQENGLALWSDHRRIAATSLSRVRGKLGYRPLVFELLPERFTLTQLQKTVEALSAGLLHKQNFRRMVESAGLVEPTGESIQEGRGRPARLYCFRSEVVAERPSLGFAAQSFST